MAETITNFISSKYLVKVLTAKVLISDQHNAWVGVKGWAGDKGVCVNVRVVYYIILCNFLYIYCSLRLDALVCIASTNLLAALTRVHRSFLLTLDHQYAVYF